MARTMPFSSIAVALFATLLSVQIVAAADRSASLRVSVEQGVLEGERSGATTAFRGIPYAAPPLGVWRFRVAQPAATWSGVRSALDFGPACPQLLDADLTENNGAVMSEDCLTLNVWTPRVDHRKRPVLVWIHGGAFVVGSTRNTFYDGEHLAARGDVIVVSVNYRLGAWGFLSLAPFGSEYAESANVGLLDQVAALKWVHANIARFGGDPDNVTLFGESAGASSIGSLLSMPAATGLFSKAILQSGVPSARTRQASQRALRLAEEFLKVAGVATPKELESKSMQELLDAQSKIFSAHSELGTFVPSIDDVSIKEQPLAVVSEGRGHRVPILIGTTAEELRYFSTVEDLGLERKPKALLMAQLQATAGERAGTILDTYQRLYPTWGDMTVQIASDALLRLPSIRIAAAMSAYQPVYMYLFTYRSNSTYKNFGSAHAMEIPFVFGVVDRPEVIAFTGRDPHRHALAETLMDTWSAFARTGNPSTQAGPRWPRYDPVKRQTMELGPKVRVVSDPLAEQRQVWGDTPPNVDHAWQLLQVNSN